MVITLEKITSLFTTPRRKEETLAALNARLAVHATCLESLRMRAAVYIAKDRYSEALADMNRVMELAEEPKILDHFKLAKINLAFARYELAEEGFRRTIRLCVERGDPRLENCAKMLLAIALLRMERLDEAKEIARALPEDIIIPDSQRLWRRHEILEYEPGMELPNVCPIVRPARGET